MDRAGDAAHADIAAQADHADAGQVTVLGDRQGAANQLGPDALSLPGLLDADRQLRPVEPVLRLGVQLRSTAQHAVDEAADDPDGGSGQPGAVPADGVVADGRVEPRAAVHGVQAPQMLPVEREFLRQKFPVDNSHDVSLLRVGLTGQWQGRRPARGMPSVVAQWRSAVGRP